METYFTADLHFGHKGVIAYCDRPFANIEEMEVALIEHWNARVRQRDRVFVLGDFLMCPVAKRFEVLGALNGRIHLIRGNHDNVGSERTMYEDIRDLYRLRLGNERVVLCHYPLETWQGENQGAYHLHGHSHGKRTQDRERRKDVGVDCYPYQPVTFEELFVR